MRIGSFRKKVNASQEYFSLARSDEIVAEKLSQIECYRQACYFIIQAMEKYIRAKAFGIVNPKLGFFREENRSHSLDYTVEFIVKVISPDPVIQQQVLKKLSEYVLGDPKYNHLHDNIRYSFYFLNLDSYSMFDFSKDDYQGLFYRLSPLKDFLNDIDKLL